MFHVPAFILLERIPENFKVWKKMLIECTFFFPNYEEKDTDLIISAFLKAVIFFFKLSTSRKPHGNATKLKSKFLLILEQAVSGAPLLGLAN